MADETPQKEKTKRPLWQRVLIGLGIAVAVVVGIVLLLLLLLQTEFGRSRVQSIAVNQIQKLLEDGADRPPRVSSGGNFLTGCAALEGLRDRTGWRGRRARRLRVS